MKRAAITGAVLWFLNSAQAQTPEFINPDGLTKPATYTQVVKAGKLLFIAGQTAVTAEGKIVGPGMKEQVDQVLTNLEIALRSQGANLSHVVKITTYVTSMAEYRAPDVMGLRTERFRGRVPASTLVEVSGLANPDYKVEIEAIAVLP
jgi:enamine deaminase RidA (YjgF/YER057c/UK114 family)